MVAVELDRFSVSVVAVLLDVLVLIESRSLAVLVLLSLVVLLLVAVLIEVMPVEDQMRDELELVKPKSEELVDCESSK